MTDQAPNNYGGLYQTFFQHEGQICDPEHADSVLLRVYSAGSTTAKFKIPRDLNTFNIVKHMVITAFKTGDKLAREEIREALGIRECSHED